ncbi:aldose epimerase family protein [Yoonia litorea]|uniref:Aldose 1-epimerase n=1 Tax=Yoonia litorea TaxID=1123755 RepID=A0A1I6LCT1_9RHOB|nr:aldose epimerase family protein [Yoonia litorea]SFS01224.1 aldose 1-epimerase [Yoonia litorea]
MEIFGRTSKGEDVHRVILSAHGLKVGLLTWGAVLQDVRFAGLPYSLTLGSDKLSDYEGPMRHHGSLIGPVVNRISNARARLDGMVYELERNQDARIHLHSGAQAAHLQVWDIDDVSDESLQLSLALPDGMCGLPGNRHVTVRYTVLAPSTLEMKAEATTDATTLMNFANHSYWNLDGTADYGGHRLWIDADHYLPANADDYPTGEIADVAGTQMDFRVEREIAPRAPAFDNNFCLSTTDRPLREVLRLTGRTGASMAVATTSPGIQIYDAKNAARPERSNYEGLAIEAQRWPDAPNNPAFPSIKFAKDQTFMQTTQWRFTKQ